LLIHVAGNVFGHGSLSFVDIVSSGL
jgi:hypothetical protein